MRIPESVSNWVNHLEHTADVRLEIVATGPDQLFVRSAAALLDLLGASALSDAPRRTHRIALESTPFSSLLVDWLNEVLYLVDGERVCPVGVEFHTLEPANLVASVSCVPLFRNPRGTEPKAVTYHQAEVEAAADKYRARFTVDI